MKLFCIPFSGGNAYSYADFKKYLPEEIELINLELPGRGKRIAEKLLTDINSMTRDLYRQVEPMIEDKYSIFGHSLGALLGLTLSSYLAAKNKNLPQILFASGQTAPCLIKPDNRYTLPDNQFIEMLRKMEGTPDELLDDKSFIQYFLPIIKTDFQSIAKYKYVPCVQPLNVRISVLIGNKENIAESDAVKWQLETSEPIAIHHFVGGHFFIFNQTKEICKLITDECNLLI
jgi:surfactin synthase thioesterase subunit